MALTGRQTVSRKVSSIIIAATGLRSSEERIWPGNCLLRMESISKITFVASEQFVFQKISFKQIEKVVRWQGWMIGGCALLADLWALEEQTNVVVVDDGRVNDILRQIVNKMGNHIGCACVSRFERRVAFKRKFISDIRQAR